MMDLQVLISKPVGGFFKLFMLGKEGKSLIR